MSREHSNFILILLGVISVISISMGPWAVSNITFSPALLDIVNPMDHSLILRCETVTTAAAAFRGHVFKIYDPVVMCITAFYTILCLR